MTLGQRIKFLRSRADNMTQKELAEILNITQQAVGKWEKDINEPDSKTIVMLCEILNCSLEFLHGRTDDPTPVRDVNSDIDAERDFDAELEELLKDEEGLVAFKDFASMDDQSKKEIIEFIKFKKMQRESKRI